MRTLTPAIWLAAKSMALAALDLADSCARLMTLLALDCTLARLAEIWLLIDEDACAILSFACWLAWDAALEADDWLRDAACLAWSASC